MTRLIAITVTTGPNARSASIRTVAGVSLLTLICGDGFITPVSRFSTYHGILSTPCESTPLRLAHTSTSASVSASSRGTPALLKTVAVNSRRSLQSTRISLSAISGHLGSEGKRPTGVIQ